MPLLAAQCERFYGSAWYFAPQRWATVDGYVPFAVAVDGWRTMQSLMAWERLTTSRAVHLGQPVAEEQLAARQRQIEDEMRLAFPRESD